MAREPGKHPRTGRTRRRGAALDEAILRAAADELTASGYAGLTMEKVASRAGTNKNALYRRWPNRLALGIAAYRQLSRTVPLPDTGTLRGDALELLRRANRHWSSPLGRILRELIAAAGGASQLLAELPEQSTDALAANWLLVLGQRSHAVKPLPKRCIHGSPLRPSCCSATSSSCAGSPPHPTRSSSRSSTRSISPSSSTATHHPADRLSPIHDESSEMLDATARA